MGRMEYMEDKENKEGKAWERKISRKRKVKKIFTSQPYEWSIIDKIKKKRFTNICSKREMEARGIKRYKE